MGLHHAREWPSGEHAIEFAVRPREELRRRATRGSRPCSRRRACSSSRSSTSTASSSRGSGATSSTSARSTTAAPSRSSATPATRTSGRTAASPTASTPRPGRLRGHEPRRLRHRHRPQPQLRRALGRRRRVRPGRRPDLPRAGAVLRARDPGRPRADLVAAGDDADHEPHVHNLVLRPPGIRAAGETVDEAAMKDLGARMAAQNGYRNIHGWQLYDTTGTTEDWSYNATGGYGYTFEIGPDEFHPPFPKVDRRVPRRRALHGQGKPRGLSDRARERREPDAPLGRPGRAPPERCSG